MSLDLRVREIPIHFSGRWQNKSSQHSLVQVILTFYTQLESLCYNLKEGTLFEVIFANRKVIWVGFFMLNIRFCFIIINSTNIVINILRKTFKWDQCVASFWPDSILEMSTKHFDMQMKFANRLILLVTGTISILNVCPVW